MSPTTAVYLVNVLIGIVLAVLLTYHWRRGDRERGMGSFTIAAWVLAIADILFYLRPSLPFWAARFYPTLLVTIGQATMLIAAQRVVARTMSRGLMVGVVIVHAIALALFLEFGAGSSATRTVLNGAIWASLSFATATVLRGAEDEAVRDAMAMPALVFALHGAFHVLRTSFALLSITSVRQTTPNWIQIAGDIEVSVFMVSLFVGLLLGFVQLHAVRLLRAEHKVSELARLLPICAWCHNVRTDKGYWQKIEEYFADRADVRLTHGICDSCAAKQMADEDARLAR